MQIPREQLVLFSWESWYQSSRENETKWFPEGPVASHADVLRACLYGGGVPQIGEVTRFYHSRSTNFEEKIEGLWIG